MPIGEGELLDLRLQICIVFFDSSHPSLPPYAYKCLIVKPPKLCGQLIKKALFSNFLFFFTFARRTKKITFFFVRNLTKTCTLFLSHLKITCSKFTFFTLCFKVRKWKCAFFGPISYKKKSYFLCPTGKSKTNSGNGKKAYFPISS